MSGVVLALNLEMIEAPDKPKMGRPTDYRPEYCQQIIEHCSEGNSFTSFCHKIGIAPKTLYAWRDAHPDFGNALLRARAAGCTWWENQVKLGLADRNFNTRAAEFMMSNQFRDEYGPQARRLEITGANGTPLLQRSMTRDELLAMAAPILDAEVIEQKQLPGPTKTD